MIKAKLILLLALTLLVSCTKKESITGRKDSDKTISKDKSDIPVQKDSIVDLTRLSKATLAAGCFWCEEAVFESIYGVTEVISGYAGGNKSNPTYGEIGTGKTGHAESIEVYYDSTKLDYSTLLKIFFASQDPTQVNGQGPDIGTQYRSIIFYRNQKEKELAERQITELNNSKKYDKPVATEVVPYTRFWPAEDYHQDYLLHNPEDSYVQHESIPRLLRTQIQIPELLKPEKSIIGK